MLEDQRYILEQILSVAEEERPDGVLIAGDIYDKAVPPAEAVRLCDDFLTRLADRGIPVFVISGNHDSAERLAFGARLMSGRGVYISPAYCGTVEPIRLRDAWGEVEIWLLPFLKPAAVRHVLAEAEEPGGAAAVGEEAAAGTAGEDGAERPAEIGSAQEALEAAMARLPVDFSRRNVLVAHQFVTGASRCESEEFAVGGLDNVDASVFDGFDYVALGHIHSPQSAGRQTVRYCGTPLKYSFSESGQEKSVTVVELREKGCVTVRERPLVPLRDMRRLRGTYLEVTARSFYENMNTDDYIQVTLTDEEDVPDGMQKLRVIYPNLMRLEYDNRRTRENHTVEAAGEEEEKSGQALFAAFYEMQNNQPMSEAQQAMIGRLLEELEGGETR